MPDVRAGDLEASCLVAGPFRLTTPIGAMRADRDLIPETEASRSVKLEADDADLAGEPALDYRRTAR